MATQTDRRPPRWLTAANRLNIAMLNRGVGPTTQRVLTIPGRTSGQPRRTPIAIVEFEDAQYIVAGFPSSDWVKNAHAARRGTLSRGSVTKAVTLTELRVEERPPILREFLRTIRGGRSFLTVDARASDEEFAAVAAQHPVFRID
jgi:deazaflavin-dependent oxidoreductase (nitroreductase family)